MNPSLPPTKPTLRVLVIDDTPVVLLALRTMLEMDGHHVDTAADGRAGVEAFARALRQQPYDIVITDLSMPEMEGGEVARAVKAGRPQTTVVLLTGWGAAVDPTQDWRSCVDHVMGKPPRLAQLRQVLAAAAGPAQSMT
ncbi:MAG: response regulator [Ramlibacter sp.]